jgi:dolichol-phosphate mannosyltransferase
MVSWIGFRQEAILYDRRARVAGTTKYSLRKMLRFATDAITAFSVKPLAMGVWLGPLILLGAFGLTALGLARWLGGEDASWPFVGAIVTAVGGLQMMVMGVMGVYLGRLVEQGRGRPLFIIDQVVRNEERADLGSAAAYQAAGSCR